MTAAEIINKLYAFKMVDKHEAFQNILPGISLAREVYKSTVTALLDNCCKELITLYSGNKKPTKLLLKQSITRCMNSISKADLDTENRDFGYELCWFLAEKVGVNLKGSSTTKIWGYWEIEGDHVKPIEPRKNVKKRE